MGNYFSSLGSRAATRNCISVEAERGSLKELGGCDGSVLEVSHPTLLHQLLSSSSPVSHTALPDFITAAFTGFQGRTQNSLLGLLFSCSRLPSD